MFRKYSAIPYKNAILLTCFQEEKTIVCSVFMINFDKIEQILGHVESILLYPFEVMSHFYTPWKRKMSGFLTFLGVLK